MRASSDAHPATALLSDFQRLDLDRARIYRRHQFDPFSGKDVSVLLQVQRGDPVVVERKLGRGRVLVQAIPLGVSWSTLPLCQAYVAMLHEWLWYLASRVCRRRNLAVGEALIEGAAAPNATAELTLPDERKVELNAGGAGTEGASFRFARHATARRLHAEPRRRKTRPPRLSFFVQRNPQESDLRPLTEQDLQHLRAASFFR